MGNKNTQKNTITYRPILINDIPAIISLHGTLIPGPGSKMGKIYLRGLYETVISQPDIHNVLGAYEGNRLVGFISATNAFHLSEQHLARLTIPLIPQVVLNIFRGRITIAELLANRRVHKELQRITPNAVYIRAIAVDATYQQQGIASALIQQIQNHWKSKSLLVDTLLSNNQAQIFYKKAGFSPAATVADSIIFRYSS
jgi:ribosomal protein S18 acetylase RimI-like enzyme